MIELKDAIPLLNTGSVGVLPTDTLYGLSCSAFNKESVERIYDIKKRNPQKPLIVLISDVADLGRFDINLDEIILSKIKEMWEERPTSVILNIGEESFSKFEYLHRGSGKVAFRIPKNDGLKKVLKSIGPIVAPSANPEGLETAKDILEAKEYFGDDVDFYVDGGVLQSEPSRLVEIDEKTGEISVLR